MFKCCLKLSIEELHVDLSLSAIEFHSLGAPQQTFSRQSLVSLSGSPETSPADYLGPSHSWEILLYFRVNRISGNILGHSF